MSIIIKITSTFKLHMCHTTMPFAFTAQKIKFSVKDLYIKCDQICKFPCICSNLMKEILNGKLHFLCSDLINTMIERLLLLLHNISKTAGFWLIKTKNGWIQETLLLENFLVKRTKQLQKYLCENFL